MKTNIEKYDYYSKLIQQAADNFMKQYMGFDELPKKLYQCMRLKMHEMDIDGLRYYDTFLMRSDKVTKNDVQSIALYQSTFVPVPENIMIMYSYPSGSGRASGAYRINEISKRHDMSFNREDLEIQLAENISKYAPKDGYSACEYCGLQTANENLISSTLVYRSRDAWSGKACVRTREAKYCSNTCAANNQMAHEG